MSDVPRDTSPTADTTAPTLDLSDWLTLAQAAAAIGVATRTVERWAKAGKLEGRSRPQARGPAVVVYYPPDVADRAAERQRAATPFVVQTVPSGNGHGTPPAAHSLQGAHALQGAVDDPLRLFAAALVQAVLSPTRPTLSAPVSEAPRLFLTIPEAAAISGLPPIDLRRACESGELKARKTGRGGWRIKRTDLEAL